MPGLFTTPIPPKGERVDLEAAEVVLDLHDKPHLLTRVTIVGPYFPERSEEPYVRVGEVRSKFVRISEMGLRVDAYFDARLPDAGEVVFGYGRDVDLIVPQPWRTEAVMRLDLRQLQQSVPGIVLPPR